MFAAGSALDSGNGLRSGVTGFMDYLVRQPSRFSAVSTPLIGFAVTSLPGHETGQVWRRSVIQLPLYVIPDPNLIRRLQSVRLADVHAGMVTSSTPAQPGGTMSRTEFSIPCSPEQGIKMSEKNI